MPTKTNRITQGEYEHLCLIDVAYEGFVEGENGESFYVYCETTVVGYFESKWRISYNTSTLSYEVPVCPPDNAQTNNPRQELSYSTEPLKQDIRKQLIDRLLSYYQTNYGNKGNDNGSVYGSGEIKVDVPEHKRKAYFQDDFAKLKSKIESGDIKRSDFKDNIQNALRREIDTYFACFDPNDPNYKSFWDLEDKNNRSWDDNIPVWGNIKMSSESLKKGYEGRRLGDYSHAVGYFLMAFADVLCFGMGTGATGLAKSGGMINTIPKSAVISVPREVPITTTVDGFLYKGLNLKSPMNISVQRYGQMNINKPDFWGVKMGSNKFIGRSVYAIKPEWNALTQYSTGVLPKGTSMKIGFVGSQYPIRKHFGGGIQIIVESRYIKSQATKIVNIK